MIPVVDVVETLRHLTDAGSETVSRIDYKLVQTPQVFDVELLQQAYAQEFTPSLQMMLPLWKRWECPFIWQKATVKI